MLGLLIAPGPSFPPLSPPDAAADDDDPAADDDEDASADAGTFGASPSSASSFPFGASSASPSPPSSPLFELIHLGSNRGPVGRNALAIPRAWCVCRGAVKHPLANGIECGCRKAEAAKAALRRQCDEDIQSWGGKEERVEANVWRAGSRWGG